MNFFNPPYFIFDTDNSAPIYAIIPKKSKSPFIGLWEVGTFNRVQKHANRVDRPITILKSSWFGSFHATT